MSQVRELAASLAGTNCGDDFLRIQSAIETLLSAAKARPKDELLICYMGDGRQGKMLDIGVRHGESFQTQAGVFLYPDG